MQWLKLRSLGLCTLLKPERPKVCFSWWSLKFGLCWLRDGGFCTVPVFPASRGTTDSHFFLPFIYALPHSSLQPATLFCPLWRYRVFPWNFTGEMTCLSDPGIKPLTFPSFLSYNQVSVKVPTPWDKNFLFVALGFFVALRSQGSFSSAALVPGWWDLMFRLLQKGFTPLPSGKPGI